MESTSRTLKIVAVDPGNNLGMACLEVDLDSKMIKAIDAHTLVLDDVLAYYHAEIVETHGNLLARTLLLISTCKSIAINTSLIMERMKPHSQPTVGHALVILWSPLLSCAKTS